MADRLTVDDRITQLPLQVHYVYVTQTQFKVTFTADKAENVENTEKRCRHGRLANFGVLPLCLNVLMTAPDNLEPRTNEA